MELRGFLAGRLRWCGPALVTDGLLSQRRALLVAALGFMKVRVSVDRERSDRSIVNTEIGAS